MLQKASFQFHRSVCFIQLHSFILKQTFLLNLRGTVNFRINFEEII